MTMDSANNHQAGFTCGGDTTRRLGRELVAGSVVVFLLFGPYLSQFLRECSHLDTVTGGRNAMWFLWEPDDIAGLLGAVFVAAVATVVIREILRACHFFKIVRLFDHAFVVALGAGVLTNLWFHTQRPEGYRIAQFGVEIQTAWMLLIGMAACSLALPGSRLVCWCTRLTQILAPAMLIVVYQLFQLPTLARPTGSFASVPTPSALTGKLASPRVDQADRPVYLFIFDEWSYRRTYAQGVCRSSFPNLAKLSEQASTFHQAHSPGPRTIYSVPSLLRGTADSPEIDQVRPGFIRNGSFTPCAEYPSIFSRAGCTDYRKVLVDWGFANHLWIADELDVARAYSFHVKGDSLAKDVLMHWYNAGRFWTDPWSSFVYGKLDMQVEDAYMLDLYRGIDQDTENVIELQPARTFAIIHYPIPHHPFLLNPDGTFHGRDWGADAYERNLAYLDRLIGKIIAQIKSAGRYEDSLLILTSDHSWRQDPELPNASLEELTHVPLIVKLPGQTQPQQIADDFRICHLGEFINRALHGQESSPAIVARLDRE